MADDETENSGERKQRRKIGGDLAYNSTPGGLERTLQAIIKAQRPERVDTNYIQTVLEVKGGTGSNQLGTLKKLGIIDGGGNPTEIYDDFRMKSRRSHAAFHMLQNGYKSIFQVNAHAHKAPQTEVENIIARVTGLDAEDPLIRTIYACFEKVSQFIDPTVNVYEKPHENNDDTAEAPSQSGAQPSTAPSSVGGGLNATAFGLNYNINIVLPNSSNIDTYNMIFKSLRENILDWSK